MGKTFNGLAGKTKEDFGHGAAQYVTYLNVFQNTMSDLSMTEKIEIDKSQNEVQYGDILFTTSSETPEEVGMSSVWLGQKPNTYLNSFCFGYRPMVDIDHHFIGNLLRSSYVRNKMKILAQGISRYNISKNKVMDLEIALPSKEEQKLIGSVLNHIDSQLTLHQRKLEHLKLKKKSLLQKLFPKEGEVYPELRFPGFTDPWEQRKLGEISEISTGFPFDSQEFNDEGEYLVITNSNIQDDSPVVLNNIGNRINIDSGREKYILDKDDLLITMDGTVGRIAKVINDRLVLAQRVCRMKSGEPSFLYQLLSGTNFIQTMNKISHGGAIKHISLSEIAEYQCHYPQNKRERDYIGIVLGDIDNLITLHQEESFLHKYML